MADRDEAGRFETDYTPELAARICEEMIGGKSLTKVCQMEGMPAKRTVMYWRTKYPEFEKLYRIAQQERAEAYIDEIIDIADDTSGDYYTDAEGNKRVDTEHINRSRLKVDTRKWIASKMIPRLYGDKVEHTIVQRPAGEMTEAELERIAAGGSAGTSGETPGPRQPSSVH